MEGKAGEPSSLMKSPLTATRNLLMSCRSACCSQLPANVGGSGGKGFAQERGVATIGDEVGAEVAHLLQRADAADPPGKGLAVQAAGLAEAGHRLDHAR